MTTALRKNDIKTLTPVEACLQRPGMYVGNINEEIYPTYLYENDKIIQKDIPQIPALIKIFSELVDNATDEAVRTDYKYANKIKVTYDEQTGYISVEDNGRGLPIEYDEGLKKWTPEVIFTSLHSGSNFNDDDPDKKQTIGMNGVGASLTAIYSKKFHIDTANGLKSYKQTIENHIAIKRKPVISESKDNYTLISYIPNYDYFNLSDEARKEISSLYYKRIKDLSFCFPEITFYYNKEKVSATKLKQFVEAIHPIYECNEVESNRIAVFYSDTEFQQISFCNSAYTSRGGTHVDYATNKIVEHIRAFIKKKHKLECKPIDIKSRMFLLLSIRMSLPMFDTQSKEKMISTNHFKTQIDSLLTEKFLNTILKNDEIILPIVETYKLKLQVKENVELKKLGQTKKKVRVDKYYPATKNKKYLVLTEGDSACNGLMSVLGREQYSYFPLRGKPLNVLEAKFDKIKSNEEIKNIVTILNLRLDKDIQDDVLYENILIASDNDLDGFSIRGLLLGFFNKFSVSLLKTNRIKFIRTPIVAGFDKKGNIKDFFFTLPEYNKNKKSELKYNYYKGLASWQSTDLDKLIKQHGINHFIQTFEYDLESGDMIQNWLSSSTVEYRKEHLRNIEFNINTI